MKKILALLLALSMIFTLAACGGGSQTSGSTSSNTNTNTEPAKTEEPAKTDAPATPADTDPFADGPEVKWSVAFISGATTMYGKTADHFKEIVEERSNGKIKVEIYPDSQLGNAGTIIEACQNGEISAIQIGTGSTVNFVPELAVFDLPLALDDVDVAFKALQGDYLKLMQDAFHKQGLHLFSMVPCAYRETTSNRAIHTMDDFKGLKIRTQENPYHLSFWKNWGANPGPLAMSELIVALQQGTFEAQENPYDTIVKNSLQEVQKYVINTNHIIYIQCHFCNEEQFQSLPQAYQDLLVECYAECDKYLSDLSKEATAASLQTIKDAGVEVIDLDPEVYEQMKEAAQPTYQMIRDAVGDELVDGLLAAMEANR